MVDTMTSSPPAYRLYRNAWTVLDWVFPPRCGGCDTLGQRWCETCQSQLVLMPVEVCKVCGKVMGAQARLCQRCREFPPAYTQLRSYAVFTGPLRQALHRLKYTHDIALGDMLAKPLVAYFQTLDWCVDLIVPTPLSKSRLKERGYNQAALLAYPIALACNIPYSSHALVKVKETRTQVGLTVQERHQNVAGAFMARRNLVENKTVLVFDDVTTSGATIESCAGAIMEAGAGKVYGLTLARAAFTP